MFIPECVRFARVSTGLCAWSMMLVVAAIVAPARAQATAPSPGDAFVPGATLADDLKTLKVALVEGYAQARPRLLFGAADRAALAAKAKAQPVLWSRVLASAGRLGKEAPDTEEIKTGAHYWRIERVQSGALAYFVTGEKTHLEAAGRWMVAHCKEPVWGVGWGENVDLHASWYLYHISLAYDMLYKDMPEADRKVVRDGLAAHAKAVYESLDPIGGRYQGQFRYDQNHTYIPTVALATTALALMGEEPAAMDWFRRAYAIMRRCRYVLGDDGYYYEGTGYWSYALHWHARYADLISRATGEKAHELPILRENWRMAIQLALPGTPYLYDVGDVGRGAQDGNRRAMGFSQHCFLWGVAGRLRSGESQLAGNRLDAREPETDYPSSAFLWFDPSVTPTKIEDVKPWDHFADHGFVAWRSGWDANATCYLFRSGPPFGHSAAPKLKRLKDWTPNGGHVHPDIGSFWMYARGAYLATDTGYTGEKRTRDHSTLLIDGVGQGMDGTYHNERGYPYERFDQVRIDKTFFCAEYGFASGEIGPAYAEANVGKVGLRRSLLMTRDWMLVVDEMAADAPRRLTWLCQSDVEFKKEGAAFVARGPAAALAVVPIGEVAMKVAMTDEMAPTVVAAGTGPGENTPTPRGFHLGRTMKEPAKSIGLLHLLVPLSAADKPPTVSGFKVDPGFRFTVNWPGKDKPQEVTWDPDWQSRSPRPAGPATIK